MSLLKKEIEKATDKDLQRPNDKLNISVADLINQRPDL
jgi:hypothetical protein